MKRYLSLFVSAAICAALPVSAQEAKTYPAPSEIVAAAKADDWVAIESSDLLLMDLTPDSKGKPRRVVIQLIPEPFSQGWVRNIRKLAAAQWWDGTSINRVQDNYVVQWGDATEQKALPEGLAAVPESEYISQLGIKLDSRNFWKNFWKKFVADFPELIEKFPEIQKANGKDFETAIKKRWESTADPYAKTNNNFVGWPIVLNYEVGTVWPIHCYGMVGVGRNLSPDTGTGAELYTVIGHAPRHLDRNIALVGRVIEGIEHMSSLPRGTGALGFYEKEEDRVPIISVRLGNEAKDVPAFEYLDTDSASFAAYAEARANRRDPFFNVPAGGADICNIPVPVRRKAN